MDGDQRIKNETEHGRLIAQKGEEIWNWSSPAGKCRWERRAAMFTAFVGGDHRRILEIGCGTGLFTQEICKTDNEITAIDISTDLIKLAQARVRNKNVIFRVENAYNTGFTDNCFDYVVGSSCLHHLDLSRALKEIYRLLKPGGAFMFTEPNMLNPQIAMQKNVPWLKRIAGDSPDETAFIRFSLAKKIRWVGFNEVSIIPFDFVHPFIPEIILNTVVPLSYCMEKIPFLKEIAGSLVIRATKPKGVPFCRN